MYFKRRRSFSAPVLMFRWLFEYVKALLPLFSFSSLFFFMSLFLASSEAEGELARGTSQRNGPRAESCQTHRWNKLKFVAGTGE